MSGMRPRCEQLDDEIANYLRRSTAQERIHQGKAARTYKPGTPGYARARGERPAIPAVLVGIGGPDAGTRLELFAETVIGRGASNDLVISSGMLSRSHARLVFLADHWMLQDLGTTNGSFVNGKQVTSCRLEDGDVVTFGDAAFRFKLVK